MATFKVIDVRRVPSADPARIGKLDYLVTYQLDAYRTYIVTVPEDTLSDEIIQKYVRKDLEQIEKFTGREFTL